MKAANLFIVLFFMQWSSAALADTVESAHVKFVKISNKTMVSDDLSHESLSEFEFKALTEKGARENGSFPIVINKELMTLDILSAETIKSDGKRIPVHDSGIVRQLGSVGHYALKDIEIARLTFPDFSQGDSAHVRYRIKSKPLFPGFAHFESKIAENLVYDKVVFELDAPESIAWQTDAVGYIEELNETRDRRRLRRWTYSNPVAKKNEDGQADTAARQPHLLISSFPSWDAVAKAYLNGHARQAEATDAMIRLAKDVTSGTTDTREKVKRIYEWVRDHIQYMVIYAGIEGWIPHKASAVFDRRYGDCKDHALLMEVLLRAVGVESVPVLIMANEVDYRLPAVPIPLFNHVISYVPELDLYLDSTAVHANFGQLPGADQGKPVLRAGMAESLGTTPIATAIDRRVRRKTMIRINDKGSANLETTLRFAGDFRQWLARFHGSVAGKENVWAQDALDRLRVRGSASMAFLTEEDGMPGFRVRQTIDDYLPPGDVSMLAFRHAENGPASIQTISGLFASKARNTPFLCRALDIEDSVTISLPKTLKLLRLPQGKEVSGDGMAFRVDYAQSESGYTMTRRFRWEPGPSPSCTPQDWQTWVIPMRHVAAALKSGALVFER